MTGRLQLIELLCRTDMAKVHLHLVGTFADGSRKKFLKEVENHDLGSRVILESWMSYEDMLFRLFSANVGLVLFQPGYKNHETALPHKAFDYMLAGLPVIAPEQVTDLAEIIKSESCGVLVDASDSTDLADRISAMMQSASLCQQLGERGKQAILTDLNWENESRLLIEMYRNLALTQS